MHKQLKWLKELLTKKPNDYKEYFYSDIHRYLGLEFTDEKKDMLELFRICGDYTKELIVCNKKLEVKEWLDKIARYITNNLEIDYLIENCISQLRMDEEDA